MGTVRNREQAFEFGGVGQTKDVEATIAQTLWLAAIGFVEESDVSVTGVRCPNAIALSIFCNGLGDSFNLRWLDKILPFLFDAVPIRNTLAALLLGVIPNDVVSMEIGDFSAVGSFYEAGDSATRQQRLDVAKNAVSLGQADAVGGDSIVFVETIHRIATKATLLLRLMSRT